MTDTATATNELQAAPDPRIERVAAELRGCLTPLVHGLAGDPPRPMRLTQEPGLDKSLASRLVQAVRTQSSHDFLHTVPSPGGLRILIQHAKGLADTSLLRDLEAAVMRFESLIDALPGGRQTLDAQMGEASSAIRERREQIARQASFKAQSFLFGHFCETLTTSLFVMPAAEPGRVDVIEVQRRIGLQRSAPSVALPLLSVNTDKPGSTLAPQMLPLTLDEPSVDPADYLVVAGCSDPLPDIEVRGEGTTTILVLRPGRASPMPARVTTAFRVLRADTIVHDQPWSILRTYMLHTPCRTLVRDLYLAEGLWPDARPEVGFYLPGPSGTPSIVIEPGTPHLRRVNLTARIEQLPPGPRGFELDGVPDQAAAIEASLAGTAAQGLAFRGWRCRMGYPVPLIEMQLSLRFSAGV
ncbi:MAG: hypothetical protein U1F07_18260 [Rubrivivax sp.]